MNATLLNAEEVALSYLTLAQALDYPRPKFWDEVEGKRLGDLFGEVQNAGVLPWDPDAVIPHRTREEREVEYLSAFELGGVPLYEGLHRRDEGREGIQEDILRFYHFFDLRLREDRRDYPDHLVTELEFMSYLASREGKAAEAGVEPSSYQRAQRDFLSRHLVVWAPLLQRAAESLAPSIYRPLLGLLASFVAAHKTWLDRSMEGEGP